MNMQDTIKKLLKADKRAEVHEVIDKYSTRAASKFREIREDASRTDEYKRWALAVASRQVRDSMERDLEQMASKVVSIDRNDAEKVFGVHGLSGDPASLVISRRDAGDRAASIGDSKELGALLSRATRTGDEVLARAIAERAMEMGNVDTLNQFLEDRPHLDEAVNRLWQAERAETDTMATSVALIGLKPEELSGMSFGSIDAMTETAEPAGASS